MNGLFLDGNWRDGQRDVSEGWKQPVQIALTAGGLDSSGLRTDIGSDKASLQTRKCDESH